MQFIVTAYNFDDKEAINRRLLNREAHLSGLERMVEAGPFLSGGAILDKNEKISKSIEKLKKIPGIDKLPDLLKDTLKKEKTITEK